MTKIKNLIVGSGISGIVTAQRLAAKGEDVLIVEKKENVGGGCFDYKHAQTGITIHKYGPHIFHTVLEEVWAYVNQFSAFNDFELKPNAVINSIFVPLPFNLNSLYKCFDRQKAQRLEVKLTEVYGHGKKIPILELKKNGDSELLELSNFVYENVFKNYTVKQWGLKPEEIDPSVMARVPVFISRDDRYFQDPYQGIPVNGYTKMFEKMLDNPKIKVELNTDFKEAKNTINYERLFYTGSIDELCDYKYGVLPYRSLSFDLQHKKAEYFQPATVVNYPNEHTYTRITEHKYFLKEQTPDTMVSYEYPSQFEEGVNERYYPISNPNNALLYSKYLNEIKEVKNTYVFGRLGDYKYYNMDQAIKRALDLTDNI